MQTLQNIDRAVYLASQTAADDITTPSFQQFRKVSGAPTKTVSYTQSAMVDPDGQAPDQVIDNNELAASIETEFSDQCIELVKKAIHGNETLVNVTGSDIEFTATGVNSGASNAFADLVAGDFFFVSGSADNNGWHSITVKTDDNNVTTAIAPTVEAAGSSITIFSRKVTSGKTRYYDILQERIKDTSQVGDLAYKSFYNGSIDTMSISVGTTGIIGTTLDYKLEKLIPGLDPIAGQTDVPDDTSNVYSAVNNVKGYFVNGESYTCQIKSMDIEITNNYEQDDASGCSEKVLGKGPINAQMSITARTLESNPFEWQTLGENSTDTSLAIYLQNNAGDKDTILALDRCKVTEPTFTDGEVFATSEFTAIGQSSKNQDTTITMYNNF